MDIRINGEAADITLEAEKNLGEVFSALEPWFESAGYRPSGLSIDGRAVNAEALEAVMDRPVAELNTLDITVSSREELLVKALVETRDYLLDYAAASPEEQRGIAALWQNGAAARFLAEENRELFDWASRGFKGEEGPPGSTPALQVIEERLREIADPFAELDRIKTAVDTAALGLEALPLDIQTGKDRNAAATVALFSTVAEKFFRIYFFLKEHGKLPGDLNVDGVSAAEYLGQFESFIKELLGAYETQDVVLMGDLAEYELAPRLRAFYGAIRSLAVLPA